MNDFLNKTVLLLPLILVTRAVWVEQYAYPTGVSLAPWWALKKTNATTSQRAAN